MGTRCLTVFKNGEDEIVVLYRQFDGYPNGHGFDLAKFLKGMKIVNGMGQNDPPKIANGIGCLAAQVIAHFKTKPGNFYLYKPGTRDLGEEYIYSISGSAGDNEPTMHMECAYDQKNESFLGSPSEFIEKYK